MHDGGTPEPMNAIALLKREEEQDTLGIPPVQGKLTHYPGG